jgi:hypothetical protein
VVSVSADGASITAVGGGVATVNAVATDSITGKSVEGHFIVYVKGSAIDGDLSLKSVTAGDVTFTGIESGTIDFDVHMPNGSTTPPVVSAVLNNDTLSSIDITQATTVPGVATITVTDKENWSLKQVYRVNFGYMTISPLRGTVTSSSWDAASTVRFSDGETSFKLLFAAYKNGVLVYSKIEEVSAFPKNSGGTVGYSIGDPNVVAIATGYNLTELEYKAFLWDENFVPFPNIPALTNTYQ